MDKIILVRYGEIGLKGNNKSSFENKLVAQIKNSIRKLGKFTVRKAQSHIYVEPQGEVNLDIVIEYITRVFGIVSVSIVEKVEVSLEVIKEKCLEQANKLYKRGKRSFKVETKRSDKRFPLTSIETSREVGGYVFENIDGLSVDVHNPDFILYVEVREFCYIYSEIIPAVGGLPVGTNGKSTLLLSGGIDSPVAGYLLAKRGSYIDAVHFHSHPYTSERAKEKVIDLAKQLTKYCGKINLYIVPFTEIQMQIYEKCPDELLTLIMRRIMMMIAEKIAINNGSNALITGESLGQVASQTIHALGVTNAAVNMPVFRPLIGMDKLEIIDIAEKIGTFETSILPYEDCCTVFVPKHPKIRPKIEKILEAEKLLDIDSLVENAVNNSEVMCLARN